MRKASVYIVRVGECEYVVSESYFYKSEAYYTIIQSEMNGRKVFPRSADIVDAYTVPICLTRSSAEGIRVCDWDISYIYATAPCLIYGIHYFSDPAQYSVLKNPEGAEELIKHVTNNGKYPFCYQRIDPGDEIVNHVTIFGRGMGMNADIQAIAAKLFDIFRIPIMNMVLVKRNGGYSLSALTPVSYSKLSRGELDALNALLEARR
ncbi:MAG: RimK-like ATPgrasp N-terminal domain-containing protein [Candidatus Thermoplasmatota archaeon]